MKNPVYFQSLENELLPVVIYLKGNFLNAGCGNRDISEFLMDNGILTVDNCDIDSSIPNAIICNLTSIPKPDENYDSILCNAVVEHVQHPELVIKELYRILKPKGILVLVIPFLQPYHPCPRDFQRYTKEGIIELAVKQKFNVIDILPVHNMAQTIAWILWEIITEKKNKTAQILLYFPLYIWTRVSSKTDLSLVNNANSYQIVLEKQTNKE